jgi:predicted metal-dependent hydrolase
MSQLPSLYLGASRIEYAVVRGTSRRYTYFRFRPNLTLEVILPRGRSVDIEKAIRERSRWLQREYERLTKTRSVLGPDAVMFDGRLFKVIFSGGPEDRLVPDPNEMVVKVGTNDRRKLRELVRRWFLRESSAYVVKKVAEMAPKVGARPSRVDVREIGKWGYCTRGGRLSFSWQLIALPQRLREYIVLHELTHLIEFNHSPAFKRRLAVVCPDYRARERELDLIVPYDRLGPP